MTNAAIFLDAQSENQVSKSFCQCQHPLGDYLSCTEALSSIVGNIYISHQLRNETKDQFVLIHLLLAIYIPHQLRNGTNVQLVLIHLLLAISSSLTRYQLSLSARLISSSVWYFVCRSISTP